MRLFGTDLVLLHPPSVYDFRKMRSEYGPISDVIFSSSAYEMYPIGLTSIASHLEEHGHNVRIVNVAHRMVSDPGYDAEAAIARLDPAVFGIGLHWLPHAHGALELARIVKRHHPRTPVVFGGLSASYFHEELIRSPDVDFVVRGDSTEEPVRQLVSALQLGGELERIPNLTWKRGAEVVVNPLSSPPTRLDGPAIPDVFYAIRSVFKYRSLADVVPFTGWLEYPITGLLTSRGCSMACAVCGGSRSAYRMICNRPGPAFRSPEALVRDVHRIGRFSRGPIFLIHDLRQAGRAWTEKTLELLAKERPGNEIVLELFSPVGDDYLERVGAALPRWSLEITLESHVERIRALNRRFDCTNEAVEHTIRQALDNGVGRVDLFFMVGIPGQTYDDAVACVDFCRSLLARLGGDRRLSFFVAPLAPFLDPGSDAYEQPERFGYRVRFRTLEEHRAALTAPNWKGMLNYETEWMARDEIVAATYEALRGMTRLKYERGQIPAEIFGATLDAIAASEEAVAQGDGRSGVTPASGIAPRFQKDDLVWRIPGRRRFAPLPSLAGIAIELALREARLLFTRRLPLYARARRELRSVAARGREKASGRAGPGEPLAGA
jgi:B12-binding domain/radical SAM domain protein